MQFKNSVFAFLLASLVIFSQTAVLPADAAGASKQAAAKRTILLTGTAAGLLGWGFIQRKQSLLAIVRYPLMQKRGILNAQLKKDLSPEKNEAIAAELAIVTERLAEIERLHSTYQTLKYIALSAAAATGIGAYYASKK